jgi:hypothetical protein
MGIWITEGKCDKKKKNQYRSLVSLSQAMHLSLTRVPVEINLVLFALFFLLVLGVGDWGRKGRRISGAMRAWKLACTTEQSTGSSLANSAQNFDSNLHATMLMSQSRYYALFYYIIDQYFYYQCASTLFGSALLRRTAFWSLSAYKASMLTKPSIDEDEDEHDWHWWSFLNEGKNIQWDFLSFVISYLHYAYCPGAFTMRIHIRSQNTWYSRWGTCIDSSSGFMPGGFGMVAMLRRSDMTQVC